MANCAAKTGAKPSDSHENVMFGVDLNKMIITWFIEIARILDNYQ